MKKYVSILFFVALLIGCSKDEGIDPNTENDKLVFWTDEWGQMHRIVWQGQYESYNPETFWKVEFFGNFRMNISESPESSSGTVKELEKRTPYTLKGGKILIEGRSFYYTYRIDYKNSMPQRLVIKSTKSTAIERICYPTISPLEDNL